MKGLAYCPLSSTPTTGFCFVPVTSRDRSDKSWSTQPGHSGVRHVAVMLACLKANIGRTALVGNHQVPPGGWSENRGTPDPLVHHQVPHEHEYTCFVGVSQLYDNWMTIK